MSRARQEACREGRWVGRASRRRPNAEDRAALHSWLSLQSSLCWPVWMTFVSSCSDGGHLSFLHRLGSLANHVDHDLRMRKHRHVTAVDFSYCGAHALCDE